jgi:nitrogen fixation regulatory protein
MSKKQTTSVEESMIDIIKNFLNAPPKDTPIEIIEAFHFIGKENILPPGIFLETVEQAPVAISITDSKAQILYVNATFEKLTGYKREQIVGQNESILSSHSTPESIYQDLWKTIQNGQVWKGTLINHRKDKEEYLAELTISPVLAANAEITYFLGMHRDITEIHQLEQRLKFQQSLTEAAINAAPMVVAMIGTDGKVLMDNLAYKALLGDFRGLEPAGLFLDALKQQIGFKLANNSGQDKNNKEFSNIEIRIDLPGSTSSRWFSCSGGCVLRNDETAHNYFNSPDSEQRYLLLIANEITSQRQRINEARLNMIRTTMIEQEMVQTMREAISAAIYKLQIPLNVIKAAIAMPGNESGQCSLHKTLQQALDSGDEAVQSLHAALPNPTVEQTSSININEILQEVIKLSTDKLLISGIVIDWRPASILPPVYGRENALRGLFSYLLDNAIHAVNEAEHVDKEIRIQTLLDNNEILIELIDNGVGLSELMHIKVFEPFFSAWEKTAKHAGMGLTMSQEILINHGGNIEIDTEFYGGCRVFIRLPVSNKEMGDTS